MSNYMRGWTVEMADKAEELWKEGISGTEIGKRLGKSRSAVLGFLNRRGLVRKDKARAPRLATLNAPPTPPRPKPPVVRPVPVEIVPKAPVGRVPEGAKVWTERKAYECQYPVAGEGGDTYYCCSPIRDLTGYCKAHRAIMFVPSRPSRNAAVPSGTRFRAA